jgi:hypothetical protein
VSEKPTCKVRRGGGGCILSALETVNVGVLWDFYFKMWELKCCGQRGGRASGPCRDNSWVQSGGGAVFFTNKTILSPLGGGAAPHRTQKTPEKVFKKIRREESILVEDGSGRAMEPFNK